MLDLKLIRSQPEEIAENCRKRNVHVDIEKLLELDDQVRQITTEVDSIRQRRNEISKGMKGKIPFDERQPLIEESKKLNARLILKNDKALTVTQLAGLIDKAQFIISNDTGPAHMAAHLGAKGVTLFGHHTTPKKVSIETNKFKAIIKDDLKELSAEEVYSNISEELSLV